MVNHTFVYTVQFECEQKKDFLIVRDLCLTFFLSHFERIRRFFSELLRAKLRYFRQRCSVLGSLKCITVLRVLINSAVSTFCQHWRPNEISWSKNQDSSRLVFASVGDQLRVENRTFIYGLRELKNQRAST